MVVDEVLYAKIKSHSLLLVTSLYTINYYILSKLRWLHSDAEMARDTGI